MIYIDPAIYVVGRILVWILFFYVFVTIYRPQKFLPLILLFIIALISDLFWNDLSYFVVAIATYFIYNPHKKINFFLLNTILLSSLLRLLAETIANSTIIIFYTYHLSTRNLLGSGLFILCNILIETAISLLFIYLYKKLNLTTVWRIENSTLLGLLIGYLFIVIFLFMRVIQHYEAYSDLLSGILLFILLQCTFIVIIFLKSSQVQKETYTRELGREQLKNLKMYTDQLEHDQIRLRSFEHNYKNQIADLRSIALARDYSKMKSSLGTLETYSNSYFDNISMQLFKDLNNVQNPYLKSLLISKLTLINQNKTTCHFECQNVVNDVDINIFDLVRLLGISIDNAIEATKGQPDSEIQIAIIQEPQQLSFLINNTTTNSRDNVDQMQQEGYTTKRHHSGFGLVNVQDIKKKYPNLFVQYRKNEKWFHLNLQIIK